MKRGVLLLLTLALSWGALSLSRWVGARGPSPAALVGDERLRPQNINVADWQPCLPPTDPICAATVSLNTSRTAVNYTALRITDPLRLGDVVALWGPPSHVQMQYGLVRGDAQRPVVIAHLYFADGLVRVMAAREDTTWRLIPSMRVRLVEYYAPNAAGGVVPIGTERWHGFKQTYRTPR